MRIAEILDPKINTLNLQSAALKRQIKQMAANKARERANKASQKASAAQKLAIAAQQKANKQT